MLLPDDPRLRGTNLKALLDAIPAPLALVRGPGLTVEAANAGLFGLLGGDDLVGKAMPEVLDDPRVGAALRLLLETGETQRVREVACGRARPKVLDLACRPVPGDPDAILVAAEDATERVEARTRKPAEADADRAARLLRFLPVAFFSVTNDWVLNSMNPAAEEVLGLRAAEVTGKLLWDVFPGLVGSRFGEAYVRAMKEGVRIVTEDYYPDYDRWYEAWAYPFDHGLAVSFFDVTQRKKDALRHKGEKEKLEAIFHGSASPMVFFRGPDLIYEMVNDKYRELVPKRELLERPLTEVLPELEGTKFPEIIRSVLETGTPVVTHEELAPLLNPVTGEIENRYFDSGVSRINDGEGKPYGVFVQATEVTDRVLARKRIEEALAARDTFLSIASHELRTPITGMKLQAQMMKRSLAKGDLSVLTAERVKKLVDLTDSGLTRMTRLVEDMLDISRIQSGKLSLNREPTDFAAFVQAVLDRFSEELAGAGIEVAFAAAPGAMPVSIDRFRMEQVLTNLITNAIKYAPGAPLSIELGPQGSGFRLAFEDRGPGISESNRERIFERFERVASANHVSGLGLGLFIVRQIVEAHGGKIYVAAAHGPGARFVLELPRARA